MGGINRGEGNGNKCRWGKKWIQQLPDAGIKKERHGKKLKGWQKIESMEEWTKEQTEGEKEGKKVIQFNFLVEWFLLLGIMVTPLCKPTCIFYIKKMNLKAVKKTVLKGLRVC